MYFLPERNAFAIVQLENHFSYQNSSIQSPANK